MAWTWRTPRRDSAWHGRQLQRLLAGQQRVSAETALRLGRLCGNGPEIWPNLQAQYDLALARERSAAQLEAVEPLVE